ncbi:MAG: hypothetical protein M3Q36_01645 [bacterium]|nr:hypothetical protein [bacterium]
MHIPSQAIYAEALKDAAHDLREDITRHMAAIGLSSEGIGLIVHWVPEEDESLMYGSETSRNLVLLCSRTRDGRATEVHIVEKKFVPTPAEGSMGEIYTHFQVKPRNHVRKRSFSEMIIDVDTNAYDDNNFNGPTFGFYSSRGQLYFNPDALTRIPYTNPEQEACAEDAVLSIPLADQLSDLHWARSIVARLNTENQLFGAPQF